MIQDALFHSLRVALDSLANEKEMMEQLEEHMGLMWGFQSSRTARILGIQPDKFHLDGVPVVQHGTDSMNGGGATNLVSQGVRIAGQGSGPVEPQHHIPILVNMTAYRLSRDWPRLLTRAVN